MGQGENDRKKRDSQTENRDGQVRQQDDEAKKSEKEIEEKEDNRLEGYGQVILEDNRRQRKIHLITITGGVKGHENPSGSSRTIKYNHVLSKLTEVGDDDSVDGFLVLLNTPGGSVDAGLAIAGMIVPLSLPTVSLVLGGSHSIGVPLAVSTNYPLIVPLGTMMIHPARMTGMVIGTSQAYEYFEMTRDRMLTFILNHADTAYDQLRELIHNTKVLTRGLGTILVGTQVVEAGFINQVGGIKEAPGEFCAMIGDRERRRQIPSFRTTHLDFNLKYSII